MDDFDDEAKTAPVELPEEVPVEQVVEERISSEFESPPIHRTFEKRRAAVMRAITESKLN
jgi:hypothetical protein